MGKIEIDYTVEKERWPEVTEQKRQRQCEGCALAEHDAYICARWRLSYAVNELKKAIPHGAEDGGGKYEMPIPLPRRPIENRPGHNG